MMRPAVSVVIPTYNRAWLLRRALNSVITQTFGDWEIVLVDDGSTDSTSQLADEYDRRLRDRFVYIRDEHRGCSSARNRGIEASRGRFIALLDSDDEFAPTKLERQLALFEFRPDLGFVYSDYSMIDLDGVRHRSAFDAKFPIARQVPADWVAPGLYVVGNRLFDTLIRGYFIATIVGLVRREVLGDSLRFSEDQTYGEEWLYHLRIARNAASGYVNESLSVHHYVPGSLARSDKRQNILGYYRLLKAIEVTFEDLTARQRAAVRCNLAQACRQVGYEAARKGRSGEAAAYFFESFRYRPSFQAAGQLPGALLGSLLSSNRARSAVTQLEPKAVR